MTVKSSGLSLMMILLCSCFGCKEPGVDTDTDPIPTPPLPVALYPGEEQAGTLAKTDEPQWYYFNSAIGCNYELTSLDADAGNGLTAQVKFSAYHADKTTPYFENEETTQRNFTSLKSERVYIKVEPAGDLGSYSLSYRVNNPSPPPTWTLMIYINAGMYLEDCCIRSVSQLIAGYHAHCDINLLVLLDKETTASYYSLFGVPDCNFTDTRLFVINTSGMHRVSGGREFGNITETSAYEANLGDAAILKRFIEYGKHNYPARYYGLIVKSHGAGSAGFCDDKSAGGDRLHPGELSAVLDESDSVNLLGFNTCLMGSAEVAYQFRKREATEPTAFEADIMVASASITDPLGWQYDQILRRISTLGGSNGESESLTGETESLYKPSELTPLLLGRIITEEEHDGLYAISPETGKAGMQTCYDLSKAATVKANTDALAVSLATHDEKVLLESLRDNLTLVSPYFMIYSHGTELDLAQRKTTPFYDLVSLCEAVEADNRFAAETRNAATTALAALDQLIVYTYNGPDTSNHYGLSVFFSNGDELYNGQPMYTYHWWYNALNVTDRSDNTVEKYYGELAWCEDKSMNVVASVDNWFEMLDAWYDPNGNGADGGCNGYQY